jgi:hypothetical protein
MKTYLPPGMPRYQVRLAGLLYLAIIVFGIASEGFVRGSLIVPGDAVTTAANIAGSEGLFRLSIAGDALMAVCDIILAVLLYVLFRPFSPVVALVAMVFRLIQAAVIVANLLNLDTALMLIVAATGTTAASSSHALLMLERHAHGYDFGLIFFGINSLATGWLIMKSRLMPVGLGLGVVLAGVVYLVGSSLVVLSPSLSPAFELAYLVPVIIESLLCLWLLAFVDPARSRDSDQMVREA